jgi:hypothetical protein
MIIKGNNNSLTVMIPSIADYSSAENTLANLLRVIDELPELTKNRIKVLLSNNCSGYDYSALVEKYSPCLDVSLIEVSARFSALEHFSFVVDHVETKYSTFLAIDDELTSLFIQDALTLMDAQLFDFVIPNFRIVDKYGNLRKKVDIFDTTKELKIQDYLNNPFGFGIYAIFKTDCIAYAISDVYCDWFDYAITNRLISKYNGIYVHNVYRSYYLETDKYIIKACGKLLNPLPVVLDFFKLHKKNGVNFSFSSVRFVFRLLKTFFRFIFQKE